MSLSLGGGERRGRGGAAEGGQAAKAINGELEIALCWASLEV